MGDLTTNFSEREFRCKPTPGLATCIYCGSPGVTVDPRLVAGLQSVRDKINVSRPIGAPERRVRVHSGYRCAAKNASGSVRGASSSQHLLEPVVAADISADGETWRTLYELCLTEQQFVDGGVGVYPGEGTVHVDVRPEPARWARIKGKYVDIEKALA